MHIKCELALFSQESGRADIYADLYIYPKSTYILNQVVEGQDICVYDQTHITLVLNSKLPVSYLSVVSRLSSSKLWPSVTVYRTYV